MATDFGWCKILSTEECLEEYDRMAARGRIATGLGPIDEVLRGGLPIGQVVGFVGGTGSRKSEVVRHIRDNVKGTGVIHLDVELGAWQIMERELAQRARIPPSQLKQPFHEEEIAGVRQRLIPALEHVVQVQVYTPPTRSQAEKWLASVIEQARAQRPQYTRWLVICDSIQRLAPLFAPGSAEIRIAVNNFMYWIDGMSRLLDVAVIATSEKSREKEPPKDDAARQQRSIQAGAESRAIEYVAAAQFVLWPDRKIGPIVGPDVEREDSVGIWCPKNRAGDAEGWLSDKFVFERPYWRLRVGEPVRNTENDMAAIMDALQEGPKSLRGLMKATGARHDRMKVYVDEMVANGTLELTTKGYQLRDKPPSGG